MVTNKRFILTFVFSEISVEEDGTKSLLSFYEVERHFRLIGALWFLFLHGHLFVALININLEHELFLNPKSFSS